MPDPGHCRTSANRAITRSRAPLSRVPEGAARTVIRDTRERARGGGQRLPPLPTSALVSGAPVGEREVTGGCGR